MDHHYGTGGKSPFEQTSPRDMFGGRFQSHTSGGARTNISGQKSPKEKMPGRSSIMGGEFSMGGHPPAVANKGSWMDKSKQESGGLTMSSLDKVGRSFG